MLKVGKAPYLECSSKGAKQFSAFYAKVNGKSIEEQYQKAKIFKNGRTGLHWKEAKGKEPVNYTKVKELYYSLWRQYLENNPHYVEFLKQQSGLSDIFGQPGSICQAQVLWDIIHE